MKYRIKIVPKATPNADGEMRDVDVPALLGTCWLDTVMTLDDQIPDTHFLAQVEAGVERVQ